MFSGGRRVGVFWPHFVVERFCQRPRVRWICVCGDVFISNGGETDCCRGCAGPHQMHIVRWGASNIWDRGYPHAWVSSMPGMFGTWVYPRAELFCDETIVSSGHFRPRAHGAAPLGDGFGEGIPQRVASPPLPGGVPRSSVRARRVDLGTFCIGPKIADAGRGRIVHRFWARGWPDPTSHHRP